MFETQEERDQNLRVFKNMAETTDQFAPMFVSDLGGKTTAIVVPFEKPEDKEMFSKIIKVMILKEAITVYSPLPLLNTTIIHSVVCGRSSGGISNKS